MLEHVNHCFVGGWEKVAFYVPKCQATFPPPTKTGNTHLGRGWGGVVPYIFWGEPENANYIFKRPPPPPPNFETLRGW